MRDLENIFSKDISLLNWQNWQMRKQNNSIADVLNLKVMVAALSLLLRNSMSSETFQNG